MGVQLLRKEKTKKKDWEPYMHQFMGHQGEVCSSRIPKSRFTEILHWFSILKYHLLWSSCPSCCWFQHGHDVCNSTSVSGLGFLYSYMSDFHVDIVLLFPFKSRLQSCFSKSIQNLRLLRFFWDFHLLWGQMPKDPRCKALFVGLCLTLFSSRLDHFWDQSHGWKLMKFGTHTSVPVTASQGPRRLTSNSIAPPYSMKSCAQHIVSRTFTKFARHVSLSKVSRFVIYIALALPTGSEAFWIFYFFSFCHVLHFNVLLLDISWDLSKGWYTGCSA